MYFIISATAKSYCNSHSITVVFLIADYILEIKLLISSLQGSIPCWSIVFTFKFCNHRMQNVKVNNNFKKKVGAKK